MKIHFWNRRFGMPILYVDPMPELEYYVNQRAMFRDGFPRPVRWFPGNWIFLPFVWIIDAAVMVVKVLQEASKNG